MRKAICNSIAAGIFIGIGGSVFLAIENKIAGAVFFTVALLCICQLDLLLYTGKIGFLAFDHSQPEIITTAVCLAGNCIGTGLAGTAIRYCRPQVIARAVTMMEDKLAVSFGRTFFTALFCGILMYAAVRIYRERQSLSGILFCVPVFILAGFEHSIADMFYAWTALVGGGRTELFLAVVVLGNTVGGLLIPTLKRIAGEKK